MEQIQSSAAANTRPFEYNIQVLKIFDNGTIYPAAVMNIKSDSILTGFRNASKNMTCLSLGSGYVTPASAQHLILNAFKNLICVSVATNFSFPQAEKLKQAAKADSITQTTISGPSKTVVAAAVVEEKKEEDSDCSYGYLFGGGDY